MKIKLIIILFTCSLFFTNCDEWLEVPSKSVISEEELANHPELIEAQFFTNYADLRWCVHSIGNGAMSYTQHHLSSYTDEGASNIPWGSGIMAVHSAGKVFGGIFHQQNKNGAEEQESIWNYKQINIINNFILKYKSSKLDAMINMVGEAYFIRAYLYFEMVKRYGGVPLHSESLENIGSINNRASEDESWEYIRLCLDSAITRLPESQASLSEDKDRANKYTALSLKSRAMLYAGTIAQKNKVFNDGLQGIPNTRAEFYLSESATAAAEVIKSNKYSLSPNFEDLFNGKDEDNNEIIFRFSNKTKTGITVFNDYWNLSRRIKGDVYTAFMTPSLDVVDQFETLNGEIKPIIEDGVKKTNVEDFFSNRDKRLSATIIYPGCVFLGEKFSIYRKTIVKKANGSNETYQYNTLADWTGRAKVPGYDYLKSGIDGIYNNDGGDGSTNWGFFLKKTLYGVKKLETYLSSENDQDAVVIRYGEIILNFAEATFELSDKYGQGGYLVMAQKEFDKLRLIHGGLPNKTMTREVVRHERFIDLLYEGFRYWDLKRWDIGITQMHQKVMKPLWPILNIDETTTPTSIYYTLTVGDEPTHLATRIKWFEERDNYSPIPLTKAPGIKQNDKW